MEFVVSVPLCPLYAAASAGAERVDELLCGWSADILEELSTGWCRVRTAYRYEGWARRECLRPAGSWAGRRSCCSAPPLPTCSAARRWSAPRRTPCPGAPWWFPQERLRTAGRK